jgi:hypothetical protein
VLYFRGGKALKNKRRTRPSPAARLRAFWLIGLFVLMLLGTAVYETLLWPGFHVTDIEVRGTSVVDRGEVVHRAAIDPATNLWLQNMHLAARRIEGIPYVAKASVHRRLPASVWIEILERTPDGCLEVPDGTRFSIDAQGRVLENDCEPTLQPLYRLSDLRQTPKPGVFLHSDRLARLQADAHALEKLQPGMFAAFRFDAYGQLEALMRTGTRVRFGGDDDLALKAHLIHPIFTAVAGRFASIKAIDLRAPGAPIVEYRPQTHVQD